MISLYMATTGGVNWYVLWDPLVETGFILLRTRSRLVYSVIISSISIVVISIVSGICIIISSSRYIATIIDTIIVINQLINDILI